MQIKNCVDAHFSKRMSGVSDLSWQAGRRCFVEINENLDSLCRESTGDNGQLAMSHL